MSEHDAHNALTATARMRALAEPVEDGKLMTFSERMYRAHEARHMHGGLDMYYRPLSSPERHKPWPELHIETASGAALDALCRDGRCIHGEGRYSCPICIVQDGRV